jgi:hypothetical protein
MLTMISVNQFDETPGGQGSLPFLTAIPVEITPLTLPVWRNKVMSSIIKTNLDGKIPTSLTVEGSKQLITQEIWRHYRITKNLRDADLEGFLEKHKNELIIVGLNGTDEGKIKNGEVNKNDYNGQFYIKDRVYFHSDSVLDGQSKYDSYFFIAVVNKDDCYKDISQVSGKNNKPNIITPIETKKTEIKSTTEIKTSPYENIDPQHYSGDSVNILLEGDITVSEPEYWTDDNYEVLPQDESKTKTAGAPKKEKQKRQRLPLDEFKKRMDAVREKERQAGVPEWQIKAVDYFATLTSRSGRFRFSHDNALIEVLKKYQQLQTTEKLSNLIQARRARMKAIQ